MAYTVFRRKRIITTVTQVNSLIKCIDRFDLKVVCTGIGAKWRTFEQYRAQLKTRWTGFQDNMLIHLTDTKLEITTYWGPELCKVCTYIFNLNKQEETIEQGIRCFAELCKYFNIPKAETYNFERLDNWYNEETGKYACSAKPILYYNEKYNKKEINNCYEYDLNSAYTSTILNKIPDLSNPKYEKKVGRNQVGFLIDDDLTMIRPGIYADIMFDIIDTPQGLKDYCNNWYNVKKMARDKFEKEHAKSMLNLPIGYCQRYNPFFRAWVVHNCNERIKKLMDEDTLICNTDAIFSKRKLNLDIGTEVGQFKEIKGKTLRIKGNNYQIDNEIPKYRGIPKEWFMFWELKNKRKYNILTDGSPPRANLYDWDWETLTLSKRLVWNE